MGAKTSLCKGFLLIKAYVVILGLASFFINRFSFYGEDVASYVTTNRFVIVYLILALF